MSIWRERFVPNLESDFPEMIKRKEPLQFLRAPSLGIRRSLERLTRGLKVPGELTLLTASLHPSAQLPGPFAVIAETGVGFLFGFVFRGLHLPELKIDTFSSLSFR